MKKILSTLVVAFATIGFVVSANAQVLDGPRFGVLGGVTSSATKIKNANSKSISLYHVGVAAELPLGGGFVLQPGLFYQVKGMRLDKTENSTLKDIAKSIEKKVGFIELPVQVQWGPDLMYFRPYVFAEPFLGYQITDTEKVNLKSESDNAKAIEARLKKESKKLEYGLSLGAGIELGSFQLSAKYFWNFGKMYDNGKSTTKEAADTIKDTFNGKEGANFSGISFTLGYFF